MDSVVSDDLAALKGYLTADAELARAQAARPHRLTLLHCVRLLLGAGEDPAPAQRGARLDLRDTIYPGTPLDWAIHAGGSAIETYLRSCGARTGDELRP